MMEAVHRAAGHRWTFDIHVWALIPRHPDDFGRFVRYAMIGYSNISRILALSMCFSMNEDVGQCAVIVID
jgi:hypothetical protein